MLQVCVERQMACLRAIEPPQVIQALARTIATHAGAAVAGQVP